MGTHRKNKSIDKSYSLQIGSDDQLVDSGERGAVILTHDKPSKRRQHGSSIPVKFQPKKLPSRIPSLSKPDRRHHQINSLNDQYNKDFLRHFIGSPDISEPSRRSSLHKPSTSEKQSKLAKRKTYAGDYHNYNYSDLSQEGLINHNRAKSSAAIEHDHEHDQNYVLQSPLNNNQLLYDEKESKNLHSGQNILKKKINSGNKLSNINVTTRNKKKKFTLEDEDEDENEYEYEHEKEKENEHGVEHDNGHEHEDKNMQVQGSNIINMIPINSNTNNYDYESDLNLDKDTKSNFQQIQDMENINEFNEFNDNNDSILQQNLQSFNFPITIENELKKDNEKSININTIDNNDDDNSYVESDSASDSSIFNNAPPLPPKIPIPYEEQLELQNLQLQDDINEHETPSPVTTRTSEILRKNDNHSLNLNVNLNPITSPIETPVILTKEKSIQTNNIIENLPIVYDSVIQTNNVDEKLPIVYDSIIQTLQEPDPIVPKEIIKVPILSDSISQTIEEEIKNTIETCNISLQTLNNDPILNDSNIQTIPIPTPATIPLPIPIPAPTPVKKFRNVKLQTDSIKRRSINNNELRLDSVSMKKIGSNTSTNTNTSSIRPSDDIFKIDSTKLTPILSNNDNDNDFQFNFISYAGGALTMLIIIIIKNILFKIIEFITSSKHDEKQLINNNGGIKDSFEFIIMVLLVIIIVVSLIVSGDKKDNNGNEKGNVINNINNIKENDSIVKKDDIKEKDSIREKDIISGKGIVDKKYDEKEINTDQKDDISKLVEKEKGNVNKKKETEFITDHDTTKIKNDISVAISDTVIKDRPEETVRSKKLIQPKLTKGNFFKIPILSAKPVTESKSKSKSNQIANIEPIELTNDLIRPFETKPTPIDPKPSSSKLGQRAVEKPIVIESVKVEPAMVKVTTSSNIPTFEPKVKPIETEKVNGEKDKEMRSIGRGLNGVGLGLAGQDMNINKMMKMGIQTNQLQSSVKDTKKKKKKHWFF